jgi:hypothetical protein
MAALLLANLALPAAAQSLPIDPTALDPIGQPPAATQGEGLGDVGRTADTGIGEVGERTWGIINREPLGRLETRIYNRVQNRIRNRIDRSYDPMANANSPFERADQQTRKGAPQ